MDIEALFVYPSEPPEIGITIEETISGLRGKYGIRKITSWREIDIAGHFIVEDILEKIEDGNALIADITKLNFNVTYEIGYAIGKKKRVFLVQNDGLVNDNALAMEIGIFDTLGYIKYENSEDLAKIISGISNVQPLIFDKDKVKKEAPVYLVVPQKKDEVAIRIISRVKKARLQFRSFDPEELGRMSAGEAIDNVAASFGVVAPLLSAHQAEADVHNMRAAFVAGLTHAMNKELLLVQRKDNPVPLDYRDLVSSFKSLNQINDFMGDLSSAVAEQLQIEAPPVSKKPKSFLADLNLGASAAENELLELGKYYLETDEYFRAERGEAQIVAGRKGSGKTALFVQLRNTMRNDKQKVVLDLKPEGFQLIKFKELVLDYLKEGTKEHTVTAFWEYLLLLEVCHKILQKDKIAHTRDHRLFDEYRALEDAYKEDAFVSEGDFAERMLKLTERIGQDFINSFGDQVQDRQLEASEITELLYKHDVPSLRKQIVDYLKFKDSLWILFDNLDKGWPPHGLVSDDLMTIRCLLDSMSKLKRMLQKEKIECNCVVFIRNDVYELLVEGSSDRGKISRLTLDWTDAELLRELLRRRFNSSLKVEDSFEGIWRQICVSHIKGEETSQYLIDRCLMRPRELIKILQYCKSHAVNLGHKIIDQNDIHEGEQAYSTELVTNISFEIRDIFKPAEDVLYEFIESPTNISDQQIHELLENSGKKPEDHEEIIDLLLWYGVIGFQREDGEVAYIYSVKYDMKRLKALIKKRTPSRATYCINPAFWEGLEVKQ